MLVLGHISSHLSVSSVFSLICLWLGHRERESMPVIPCRYDAAWQQMSLCLLAGKVDQTAWWRVKKSFRCPYRGLWKIKRSILLTPLPEQCLYPSPLGWETGTNNADSGLSGECERTVDQTHGLTPFKSPIRSFLGNVTKSQTGFALYAAWSCHRRGITSVNFAWENTQP